MCSRLSLVALVLVTSWTMAPARGGAADGDPEPQYLSGAAADRIVALIQGWGELGMDTSVKPLHQPPMKLRIHDREYERGLGHHANGEIVVELAGQFQSFHAEVGIQWQQGQDMASVIFQVLADDQLVFDSGIMREGDAPRPINLSVAGVEELRLVADDAGDGITCDCANWAEARLVPDPRAARRPPILGADIAPFARIATWDPARMTGTAADRVQEFPADDIQLHRDVPPQADGTYPIPTHGDAACIGLQWDENRMLRRVALEWTDASAVPDLHTVQLQTWIGESAWQGKWEPVSTQPEQQDQRVFWDFRARGAAQGTQKVRWVFSSAQQPLVVRGLQAYSRSRWITADLHVTSLRSTTSVPVAIDLYNGAILNEGHANPYHATWNTTEPLQLQVQAAVTKRYKADRTVLQFRFPDTAFGVAVEDVLEHGAVYVPHADVFVTNDPAAGAGEAYRAAMADRQKLLDQVRTLPDQTFAQALEKVHNPIQNLGPMMLSLACDSRKFVAEREGTILFDTHEKFDDPERPIPTQWRLIPRFGRGSNPQPTRHLTGTWLPAPTITIQEGDVSYSQCTYVAPLDDAAPAGSPPWVRHRAVGVVEFTLTNRADEDREASLELTLHPGEGNSQQVAWEHGEQGILVKAGERLLALLHVDQDRPWEVSSDTTTLTLSGTLAAQGTGRCTVYLPAWPATLPDRAVLLQAAPYFPRLDHYWTAMLQGAMQIELPDELLTNVIRASQVHCMLAARNEDAGRRVSPWISSDRYGPLESEANSIIRGMGLLGHDEFAQRSLDYFTGRYNAAGYLTTGYTMVGTGEHLWTLAEHYRRVPDEAWLRAIAPELARVCQWVVAQRAKTRRLDGHGQRVPENGLFPPGVTADWNRYAYRFFNDAQYCRGLETAAGLLADVDHPDAPALLEDARQYRRDLLRAYRWAQARTPVVLLEDGTWVPGDPALLDCPGRVEDFLPGEDGNRSWAYSVELGAHHLAATEILDPRGADVGWMLDYLEEQQFLRTGMGDYPEAKSRQDPYNLGGFAKVQPYYGRFAEVYALRDDVKPFIRAYFNAIPSLLSLENLSFWEHFHNIAGWNKTHETGWYLCQTRIMLVLERGDELWLAPFASAAWLADGQQIAVRAAPTTFGRVSYTIRSDLSRNRIEATVEPPARSMPTQIVLRVRHPQGQRMRSVIVDDQAHVNFDPDAETVTLAPSRAAQHIVITY